MGDIKSAAEIAREKIEKLGEATEEERLRWKYLPEGELLAGKYLKDGTSLVTDIEKYDAKSRQFVVEGLVGVLMRNLIIPKTESDKRTVKRVMDGIKLLKTDKTKVENAYNKLRYLFNHYTENGEKQKKAAYEALKEQMDVKLQQAMQQQMNPLMGQKMDVTRDPQFQQEWRKIEAQFEAQYAALLNEYKKELAAAK
jgi:hypothetical protein